MPIQSQPVYAEFPAVHFTCGAGVAIFHVKSERVVLCYHTLEHHWFLPKGRRDAGEETRRGAEREGFEEVRPLIDVQFKPARFWLEIQET